MGSPAASGGRTRRLLSRVPLLVLAVTMGSTVLASPAEAATAQLPRFTGAEFKAFYYASLPLPGTQRITSRPPIYGHAGADQRIQQLAERRGYRLQVTPTVGLGGFGGVTLAADAGHAWVALLAAARSHGTPLQGNSGYRSIATQREIFRRRLGGWSTAQIASGAADGAIESVLAYHSIPGYSRHHTGKTLDLSAAGGSNGSFASSAAYAWLSGNNYQVAKSFGFIPNYPPGAGAQGPNPEPWEFVYVGVPRIRCAIEVVALADPDAGSICGRLDTPLVGELTGDGLDDVFVYRSGSGREGLFPGTASRAQAVRAASPVNGRYQPVVGDFDGNDLDDVLWYAPGTASDFYWFHGAGGAHSTRATKVNAMTYQPIAGDFDGNGIDDILWYAPGTTPDFYWFHRPDGNHSTRPAEVNATTYRPVAGDFDGNGTDDILWYAPGTTPDFFWIHRSDGTHSTRPSEANGTTYRPVAGDFDGNLFDDILWYSPGGSDFVWYHRAALARTARPTTITGEYSVGTGDHDGDGFDDVIFLAPLGGRDSVWFGKAPYGFTRLPRLY